MAFYPGLPVLVLGNVVACVCVVQLSHDLLCTRASLLACIVRPCTLVYALYTGRRWGPVDRPKFRPVTAQPFEPPTPAHLDFPLSSPSSWLDRP